MAGHRGKPNRRLMLKHRTWWFRYDIPEKARPFFDGKRVYMESLGTGDIMAARDRRDLLELEVKKRIQEARSGKTLPPLTLSLIEQGRQWRETLHSTDDENERDIIIDLAAETSEKIKDEEGRRAFDAGWAGKESVGAFVEEWLESLKAGSAGFADKTVNEKRGLLRQFTEWATLKKHMLPDISRKVAGEYVAEKIEGRHKATAKKHLTALIGYWDYLLRRGKIAGNRKTDNPWKDQLEPSKRKQGIKEEMMEERPYTDEELLSLLFKEGKRKHDAQLRELSLISFLSGMRLAEITSLTVDCCRDGKIDLGKSKTAAGVRAFPIHSQLKELFERRMKGKQGGDFIFHEFARMPNAADTMGKAFANRRKDLKIDEKVGSRRRSLVNFHSFRKTFVTKARHAGMIENTIADIVGHDIGRKTMTFGKYNPGGASWTQRVECVEAVKVPTIGSTEGSVAEDKKAA
ncbi:tyrosine-type recombinase/integrase [Brucella sp. 2280]|uniref:tyrosine-type recombinase/integrase n=1 Tax=Brucella sp. 2280 TaxID=2592625 RepID=UPI001297691C|nr:tyrosine-type recombinase/integrase [Brucella sp. 2280]QGA57016.1 tyrosine-type recombinase/integrase [Brucella sp. 2280]